MAKQLPVSYLLLPKRYKDTKIIENKSTIQFYSDQTVTSQWRKKNLLYKNRHLRMPLKASLTFKCMTEHLFADFSYSVALDTYLWKQMMQVNRELIHIWYNVDKKHLLFTKRKCHRFSWLFTASRCSPRRRSICACRIACKVLVSIGLYSLSFGFLKKGFLLGKPSL